MKSFKRFVRWLYFRLYGQPTVTFGKGTYSFGGPMTVTADILIRGQGPETVLDRGLMLLQGPEDEE